MTIDELKKIIEETMDENLEYEYFGVRSQYETFELGEMDHVSHIWDDGEDTGEELNGVCATKADSREIRLHCGNTYGTHCAIIAGNDIEYGEDAGEIIIRDAVVVRIIR